MRIIDRSNLRSYALSVCKYAATKNSKYNDLVLAHKEVLAKLNLTSITKKEAAAATRKAKYLEKNKARLEIKSAQKKEREIAKAAKRKEREVAIVAKKKARELAKLAKQKAILEAKALKKVY